MHRRIFILTDLEGCAGVWQWCDAPRYHRLPLYGVREVNTAIEGALEAGAEQVIVAERMLTHGDHKPVHEYASYCPDARVRYVFGRWEMLARRMAVDGAFLLGYHPRSQLAPAEISDRRAAGQGILPHSMSHTYLLRVNGVVVGEHGLEAAYLGALGIPILLFTGDETAVAQMRALCPATVCAAVKRGLGPTVALSLHPHDARARVREAAVPAMRAAAQPLDIGSPGVLSFQENPLQPEEVFRGRTMKEAYHAFVEPRIWR